VVLYGWLYAISAPGAYEGFLLSPVSFGVALGLVLVVLGLLALPDLDWNLFWAWALVGSVAIYFPALFQRKLAMGLFIAWGVVAAFGLASLIRKMERSPRNMVSALAILVFSASSILWLQREVFYLRENVSSTTVHSVYYGADVGEILALLNEEENVSAIAMPGVANSVSATVFTSPYLPDLNALLSGMAGAYTYAGHWSETPDYLAKRNEATAFFLEGQGVPSAVDGVRPATREAWRGLFLAHHGIDYIVAPVPATFPELRLADLETYGEIVYSGTQFKLIRVD
jgi:arabinosyltransferase C